MNHHVIATACVLTLSFGATAGASLAQREPETRCYDAARVQLIGAWARAPRDCNAVEGEYSEGCADIARRGRTMMMNAEVDPATDANAVCVRAGRSPTEVVA